MCPDTCRIHQLICDMRKIVDDIEDEKIRLKLLDLADQTTEAIYEMVDNKDCE